MHVVHVVLLVRGDEKRAEEALGVIVHELPSATILQRGPGRRLPDVVELPIQGAHRVGRLGLGAAVVLCLRAIAESLRGLAEVNVLFQLLQLYYFIFLFVRCFCCCLFVCEFEYPVGGCGELEVMHHLVRNLLLTITSAVVPELEQRGVPGPVLH